MIQYFSIHGLTLQLESDSIGVIRAMEPYLDYFQIQGPIAQPDIVFCVNRTEDRKSAPLKDFNECKLLYPTQAPVENAFAALALNDLRIYRNNDVSEIHYVINGTAFISQSLNHGSVSGTIFCMDDEKGIARVGLMLSTLLIQLLASKQKYP